MCYVIYSRAKYQGIATSGFFRFFSLKSLDSEILQSILLGFPRVMQVLFIVLHYQGIFCYFRFFIFHQKFIWFDRASDNFNSMFPTRYVIYYL